MPSDKISKATRKRTKNVILELSDDTKKDLAETPTVQDYERCQADVCVRVYNARLKAIHNETVNSAFVPGATLSIETIKGRVQGLRAAMGLWKRLESEAARGMAGLAELSLEEPIEFNDFGPETGES